VRILHVIQRYPPAVGGSETWCAEVARYEGSTGDDVQVLTLDVLEEAHYWEEPAPNDRLRRLGHLDWDGPVLVERCARSLPVPLVHRLVLERVLDKRFGLRVPGPHSVELYGRLFSRVRWADVVHLHTVPYPHNLIGYLVARRYRKRVVITPYFHPGHPHYERWSNYWLLRRCDAVFTLTAHEREHLIAQGVSSERIIVTGGGLHIGDYGPRDVDRVRAELLGRYGLPPATKFVLCLGRKAEYKGISVLIEAMDRCAAARDAALILAGPSLPWFETYYAGLPDTIRRRVLDVGYVSHDTKVDLLNAAHVLVLPSPFESFGLVFLESWALGRPVVGSDAPPVVELIGDAGLTFRAGDADDLAAKLDVLLADENLASRMGARGRERVLREHRWERIGQTVRRVSHGRRGEALRVLVCTNLFPPHSVGGSEVVAYKQGRVLQTLGHEVRVFAGRLADGLARRYAIETEQAEFDTTWVTLSPEDLGGRTQNLGNDLVRKAFARVLDSFDPDVVHFHNVTGLSVHVLAECEARRLPTVMTLHDYWGICFKNLMIKNDGSLCLRGGYDCLGCLEVLSGQPTLPTPVRNAHVLLSLLKVDRFVSPSEYLARRFVDNGLPSDRVVVIRNGIDVQNFRVVDRRTDTFTVGCVGQLVSHKGVEVLLRAIAELRRRNSLRLLVVGDGDHGPRLHALSKELGLRDIVTFTGRIPNQAIASVFEQLDVLAVPSLWPENSPVTITEAMATGLPVIASNLGGIPELVEHQVTGLLVPPNDPHALAGAIEGLRLNPEMREMMGRKGRSRIEEHELTRQVERLLALYRELVDRGTSAAHIEADVLLFQTGAQWNIRVRDLVYAVAATERDLGRRLLLCRLDLADDVIFSAGKLLILPEGGATMLQEAIGALSRGIPLVVDAASDELRELCVASGGGLFYGEASELQECLNLLIGDDRMRNAMAESGRRFVLRHGTQVFELVEGIHRSPTLDSHPRTC
jgi:glycosyltransferase involved in cell wall biosynthesis